MFAGGEEPIDGSQARDRASTIQEISGGDHGQTYMGGQFGQYIRTQVIKTYNTVGGQRKPGKKGEFQVGCTITVHENCPISLNSGIFNATLHSEVTGDRKAAVKIIASGEKNFREAKIYFSVPQHKNIVERIAADTFDFRGRPSIFIAMERCDCNLHEHIKSEKKDKIPFDTEKYIWIAYQILTGLDFLHLHNVVHGDLKPSNVLLILNGNIVKLSDFGLSKAIDPGKTSATVTSPQAGSMGWQAPETLKGATKICQASDIFPGGLVLHFTWSHGAHAYGDKSYSLNHNIAEGINQDLSKMRILNSRDAENLVRQMLQNDPTKRPTAKQALENKIFAVFGPKPPKVTDSRLHEIVNNAVDDVQSGASEVRKNRSINDANDAVISLGVTLAQLSDAMNLVFDEKKINLTGPKETTDKELQEFVDIAMKHAEGQSGKAESFEKKSLNLSADQLAKVLKKVQPTRKLSVSEETTDKELQDFVDKAMKHMEGQDGKAENFEKKSLNLSVDQLANALKKVQPPRKHPALKETTDKELQDFVDKAVRRMGAQSGKAENFEKKSLNFSVDQLANVLHRVQLTRNPPAKETTDTVLHESVDKAVKRMEGQGGKAEGQGRNLKKRSLTLSVDPLAYAMNDIQRARSPPETSRNEFQDFFDKVEKHAEGQGVKVKNADKKSLNVSLDQLTDALEKIQRKKTSDSQVARRSGARSPTPSRAFLKLDIPSAQSHRKLRSEPSSPRGEETIAKLPKSPSAANPQVARRNGARSPTPSRAFHPLDGFSAQAPKKLPTEPTSPRREETITKLPKSPPTAKKMALPTTPLCRRGCVLLLFYGNTDDKKFLPIFTSQIFGTSSYSGEGEFISSSIQERLLTMTTCSDGITMILITLFSRYASEVDVALDENNFRKFLTNRGFSDEEMNQKVESMKRNVAIYAIDPRDDEICQSPRTCAKIVVNINAWGQGEEGRLQSTPRWNGVMHKITLRGSGSDFDAKTRNAIESGKIGNFIRKTLRREDLNSAEYCKHHTQ